MACVETVESLDIHLQEPMMANMMLVLSLIMMMMMAVWSSAPQRNKRNDRATTSRETKHNKGEVLQEQLAFSPRLFEERKAKWRNKK
jgi:uncharacterized membrane protein